MLQPPAMAPPVTAARVSSAAPRPRTELADNVPELGRQELRATQLEAVTEQAKRERKDAGAQLALAKTPAEKTAAQKKVDAAQAKLEKAFDASTKARDVVDA